MPKVPARPRRAKSARRGAAIVRVPFHGEEIDVVRQRGRVFVSIRKVSDSVGVSSRGQLARLRRADRATGIMTIPVAPTVTMMLTVGADGKLRKVACIDLDALPMWLATIDVGRVRPELREKLILYQREAARVLRDHFFGRAQEPAALPQPAPLALPPASGSAALHRLETVEHVLDLIEQDLAALALLGLTPCPSKLLAAIHGGFLWAFHAVRGAHYALDEPGVRERFDAVNAHWKRLCAAVDRL